MLLALPEIAMPATKAIIHLRLSLSPALNDRLEQLAASGQTTKTEILRKAIALYDIACVAKAENKRIGIIDQNNCLITEIIGI